MCYNKKIQGDKKMQTRLTSKAPLLRDDGTLTSAGYATEPVLAYNRKAIHASKLRVKEWDYYYIGNERNGIALTIADNGYMGLLSICTYQSNRSR